jgi:hypothetical protein
VLDILFHFSENGWGIVISDVVELFGELDGLFEELSIDGFLELVVVIFQERSTKCVLFCVVEIDAGLPHSDIWERGGFDDIETLIGSCGLFKHLLSLVEWWDLFFTLLDSGFKFLDLWKEIRNGFIIFFFFYLLHFFL